MKKDSSKPKKLEQYDHKKIEKKWRKVWDDKKIYQTLPAAKAKVKKLKPYYVLDMFPYPSGAGLHVGHPRGYIASDIFARMKRMQGFNVLHPMGFDSFGLPAEQYAIATGKNPGPFTNQLVKHYREQLSILGFSYDWNRQVATHDPEFYKWTQWIFLKIYNSYYDEEKQKARPIAELVKKFEKTDKNWKKLSEIEKEKILMNHRLAYEGYSEVNWCPELGTVLANDEIVEKGGKMVSERGEFPVEKKSMRQWFMRITAYADRLIDGLDTIDWPNNIKEIQKNWIGKSEGSEIDFKLSLGDVSVKVFTTRADTLFGVTYIVLAPEHPLIQELKHSIKNWNHVAQYIESVKNKSAEDRVAAKEKTGVEFHGVFAINPANGEQVPVWVADYVLNNYGTGAVMAVPAHDERDFEFAKKYDLPIKKIIEVNLSSSKKSKPGSVEEYIDIKSMAPTGLSLEYDCWPGDGKLINSLHFDGMMSEDVKKKITEFVGGKLVIKYKMRDAIFARQRYWGEPIPLMHHKDGAISEVAENKLPLKLPNVKSYKPSGTGESPLATVSSWVKSGYETNTMPGWAGSSWYFLRYMDPKNKKKFADEKEIAYWKNVDMYVGGSEHATGHLLYSRFWNKVLKDLGYVKTEEPFRTLRNQGFILAADGRKMSKRWGNVVNPDEVVRDLGADTMRVYESFMGPFEATLPWSTDGIVGSRRFIERVWKLQEKISDAKSSLELVKTLHKTIKKVSDDIANFSFNTAVSAMMIFVNTAEKSDSISRENFKTFLQILAPFAPHITDELWSGLGEKGSIHLATWPKYDSKLIVDDTITLGIQVNGKVRAEITIAKNAVEQDVKNMTLQIPEIVKWIDGKEIRKFIYIPGKIISIVI